MFHPLADRRVRRQENKKEMLKLNAIVLAVCVAFLIMMSFITRDPLTHKPVGNTPAAQRSEKADIRQFAYLVTQPVDSLSQGDLALLDKKADDVCYEKYVMLKPEEMIVAIEKCKGIQ